MKKLYTSNFTQRELHPRRGTACAPAHAHSATPHQTQRKFAELLGLHLPIRVSVQERFEASNLGAAGEATSVGWERSKTCSRTPDKKWSLVLSTEALKTRKNLHARATLLHSHPRPEESALFGATRETRGSKKRVRAQLRKITLEPGQAKWNPFPLFTPGEVDDVPRPPASP